MIARAVALSLALSLCAEAHAAPPAPAPATSRVHPDMQALLDRFDTLHATPIETLTPEQARLQPTMADAAKQLADERPRKKKAKPTKPRVESEDRMFPGAGGMVPARVFTPTKKIKGLRPIIVWFHGGGFVLASLDAYDPAPRRIAAKTGAIVVAASYRQAPEFKFPAAHDDAFAAWQWTIENARSLGGDPDRMAVAGEGVGGNLAINVALRARAEKVITPRHMLLVYPMCGGRMTTDSYLANATARPLGKATMEWYARYTFEKPDDLLDPRIDIVSRDDLAGLPSATIITAELDPLRSEGHALADLLVKAGVKVDYGDYLGVTHNFFGMSAVLADAKAAQDRAVKNLTAALE